MRDELKCMPLYVPPSKELINLANNENHHLQWREFIEKNFSNIAKKIDFSKYGNSQNTEIKKEYAKYLDVLPEELLVASGSDTIIPLLVNTLCTNKVLSIKQDFFRYAQAAVINKINNINIEYQDGYIDDIIVAANKENVDMILFSNPNNPLGIIHKREDIIKILDNTSAYVVIDEAYGEFSDEKSCANLINKYDKLIVLKTMSKAWGLASLRIGFAITNKKLIEYLKIVQGPFVISDLNSIIASEIIKEKELLDSVIKEIIKERDEMYDYLVKKEINATKSHANFIYIEDDKAELIKDKLLENNIAVAFFPPNKIRMSIATKDVMNKVKSVIDKEIE